jgi:lysophospholipase L1-like esterase
MTTRRVGRWTLVLLYCVPAACFAAAPAKKPEPRFEAQPSHAMLAPGGAAEIRLRAVDAQNAPLPGELLVQLPGAPPTRIRTDTAGWATYRFQATAAMPEGILTLELRHATQTVKGKYYVDLVDQATYDAFQAATDAVRADQLPLHLLFIGDSLTDMLRGQNYVDKVGFWLGRRFGARATVKNVGVGGDMITRVWDRLQGVAGTYRLEMYQSLFAPRPTDVFFFLGHNDSKLTSVSGYKEHAVEPGPFATQYRQALRKVQAETGARLAVLSATSSVWEITRATAEKRRATGKPHTLFGKPEELERFNTLAQRAAAECGARWLDVYEPTRRHAQKPSLFTADGVHVSNLGNRLLALEILKYLHAPGDPGRATQKP